MDMEASQAPYVRPVYSTVEVAGLTGTYTFLHITDMHVCAWQDVSPERREACRIREEHFSGEGMTSRERMPHLFAYGEAIRADRMLLTGDMIDFPSPSGVATLKDCIRSCGVPSVYAVGNHDWSYADDYISPYARAHYLPQLEDISGGCTDFHYEEVGELIVAAMDNALDRVSDRAMEGFSAVCRMGKPIILIMHIPLTMDSLHGPTAAMWGRDICMGPGGVGYDREGEENVRRLYRMVALEPSPVVAVVAGHIHFGHEDTLPNGVPQLVTELAARNGACRVITVKGKA